jgi:hypothetical protein
MGGSLGEWRGKAGEGFEACRTLMRDVVASASAARLSREGALEARTSAMQVSTALATLKPLDGASKWRQGDERVQWTCCIEEFNALLALGTETIADGEGHCNLAGGGCDCRGAKLKRLWGGGGHSTQAQLQARIHHRLCELADHLSVWRRRSNSCGWGRSRWSNRQLSMRRRRLEVNTVFAARLATRLLDFLLCKLRSRS